MTKINGSGCLPASALWPTKFGRTSRSKFDPRKSVSVALAWGWEGWELCRENLADRNRTLSDPRLFGSFAYIPSLKSKNRFPNVFVGCCPRFKDNYQVLYLTILVQTLRAQYSLPIRFSRTFCQLAIKQCTDWVLPPCTQGDPQSSIHFVFEPDVHHCGTRRFYQCLPQKEI